MPEQIISASGLQYGLIINPDGSINVSGVNLSVGSISVAAGSESWIKGGSIILYGVGSVYNSNTNFLPAATTGSVGGIIANTETMVVEFVITAGSSYYLTGFDATASADSRFKLLYNDALQTALKINAAERNIQKTYSYPLRFPAGSVVVTGKHQDSNNQGFEATLYGQELSA